MRIHHLQHVPFEDIGVIQEWADEKGWPVTRTQLFYTPAVKDSPPRGCKWPTIDAFDLLVIMGGPMNIYEEKKYPFLKPEKKFIEAALKNGKKIIGICLGAQMLCDVLGGKVRKNKQPEIGWFPVSLIPGKATTGINRVLPKKFMAFHWHGDTFSIPAASSRIAGNEACRNQAFMYRNNVLGFQFHLEITRQGIQRLLHHCRADLQPGKYVQNPEQMLSRHKHLKNAHDFMRKILKTFETI